MNRNGISLAVLAVGWTTLIVSPPSFAVAQISFLERGITVDDVSDINSSMGLFESLLSNTNKFGTAAASIISEVTSTRFFVSGDVSEYATKLDKSFDPRAVLFMRAEFSLANAHEFEFNAFGGGASDSEHWESYLIVDGPDFVWEERWDSVGTTSGQVARTGVFFPGNYEVSVRVFPIVYGGMDQGWANAGIQFDLVIDKEIYLPEPSSLVSICAAIFLYARGRWRTEL